MRVIHSLIAPPRPPAPATMGPPLRRRATVTAALLALVLVAEEVTGRIGAAGRDCVARQRDSIVAFQSRTGVEVYTFSLILKNAASLLANKDPLKVEAGTRLEQLIRSFSDHGNVVETSNFELPDDREKMKDGLASTISALDKFEQCVKDCLGV